MTPILRNERSGFTLIEVIAALVVFSLGVLMVIRLTGAVSLQLDTSSLRSAVVAEAQERTDSISLLSYSSVAVGTTVDTIEVRSQNFVETIAVTQASTYLREVAYSLVPIDGATPSYNTTLYILNESR